jgi:glycosyltransferase involved in cell wall biosynthesis
MATILHITEQLGIGGTEVLLRNTVPLLTEYNHVICYLGWSDELKIAFAPHPVYCLEHRGKKDILRSVKRLRKISKQHKVDIIHAHLFWPTLIARFAKPRGAKLLSSIHSILSKDAFEKNKLSLWAERVTANCQDALVAVSQYALADYLQYVGFKGATHVLYNFIPDHFFLQKDRALPFSLTESLHCIAVGSLKAVKNYSYTIAAFSKMGGLPVSLDIYGEGTERGKLQQAIDAQKVAIQLKGSQNNLTDILPGYDLFIQVSLYEGFGIALVEAMACGLVPVLSDIHVHREVADSCAFFVSLTDPQALAVTLKAILNDKELSLRKREMCRQRARDISSQVVYLEKLRLIYTSLPG